MTDVCFLGEGYMGNEQWPETEAVCYVQGERKHVLQGNTSRINLQGGKKKW